MRSKIIVLLAVALSTTAAAAQPAGRDAAPAGEAGSASARSGDAAGQGTPEPGAGKQADAASKQEAASKQDAASKEEVRTLAEEIRRLKLEIGLRDVEYQSYAGMGPAASKVYFAPKGLSIGGYGEITYQNMVAGATGDQTDLLRAVLYAGYRFNEKIVFNSEIEFEHAGHEVSVEFAYLDFLLRDAFRVRVGNVLVPLGFINEMHEPAFFNGVFRPDVERLIIPTTWSENGLGVHGQAGGFRYKAYALTGLDLTRETGDEPIEAGTWVRSARSGGAESRAATFAGVVSLEYAAGPAAVGAGLYRGRADQRRIPGVRADVTLAETHAQVTWRGATARAIAVAGALGDAAGVNAALGLPTDAGLGSRVWGGYGELAYDLLSALAPGSESSVSPFVRYERYDLNAKVPAGYTRDAAVDRSVVTAGLTYKPIPTVVAKADYQHRDSRANDAASQVNFGVGFVF
jgi:hypothetical protein